MGNRSPHGGTLCKSYKPDSSQDEGNSDEKSVVIEDLPWEASQKQAATTRKPTWQLRWPTLLAGALLLLVAVIAGVRLLPQAPRSQPLPGSSSHQGSLPTPTPTPIFNGGPVVSDHSVHPTVVDGVA